MTVVMVRVGVTGDCSIIEAKAGESLSELQSAVGGLIDVVSMEAGIDMWGGDNAMHAEPVNRVASRLLASMGGQPVYWGPVVFAGCDSAGTTVSLNRDQATTLAGWLRRVGAFVAAQCVIERFQVAQ
ncbi:hypothetical protein GOEFS_109_00020 [Gordonia effusa NBRC 100432]|uniref:DUF3846 domain-containing protein n=1 Tax=Gordonia effusa NBRC 100432 TaxID=1077974 RepID=H0R5A6_9ACTN|nr:DUF3846 domain-containing protein [Gordonia effusa]GAB20257.1 hypothetical protein GOEFS_109_00020 [Gordonia effusa NBRC 100432]